MRLLLVVSYVAKQYNLVLAEGRRCCAAEKVTAGQVESNGSRVYNQSPVGRAGFSPTTTHIDYLYVYIL